MNYYITKKYYITEMAIGLMVNFITYITHCHSDMIMIWYLFIINVIINVINDAFKCGFTLLPGTNIINHNLHQNDDKTEFVVIGSLCQLKKVELNDIKICEVQVSTSEQARDLGVFCDQEMNHKAQVNNICKSGSYHIRNLSAICSSLDLASAKMATHAFVTSTLDYSNSLFYGLPNTKPSKLQIIQNAAARVLIQVKKSDRKSMNAVRKERFALSTN